jgi:hypothetical protein
MKPKANDGQETIKVSSKHYGIYLKIARVRRMDKFLKGRDKKLSRSEYINRLIEADLKLHNA